ncbi:MAG: type I restriction enzyme HsdR N-terminal domain-containing protein [Bacteroidales bacterium]|nr:type I restriction enzyme HsdR N-terminal domain-containing protein [Bacteroidales bacterium]
MKSEKLFNILEGFDLELLHNPEFKEDSVREEIILPIIKGLGYHTDKPYQIVRSRKLLHPFVSIGSKRKDIYIIPDYLLEVDNKPAWILDAKSPSESIIKSIHVEQAYSYSIHCEVRVKFFALCNGLEFALYNIEEVKPILHFPIKALPLYWETLKQYLTPENIFASNPLKYSKDLGLHLKRLGFDSFESLIFPNVPITNIGQIDPDYFSLSGTVNENDERFVVTFDFGINVFEQLKGKIPDEVIKILSTRKSDSRQTVKFGDRVFFVNIDCKIGSQLAENDKEIFLPLWINSIID